MNKLVKGSLAAAAGITLLMGGAGSLAIWNDSSTAAAGSITTGELTIDPVGAGTWATGIDVWVPEDTDTYTQEFDVTAVGDNISFIVEADFTDGTVNGVETETTVTVDGVPFNSTVEIGEGDHDVIVTVVVTFDATGTADQNETVTLGDIEVTVTQVP